LEPIIVEIGTMPNDQYTFLNNDTETRAKDRKSFLETATPADMMSAMSVVNGDL